MRRTKARFAILLVLPVLGCGKSEAKKREEVRSCSRITMDAPGAALCLVKEYRWRKAPAESAAAAYERQRDSIAQFKADSAWRVERSEERRVGKECRCRWETEHEKKKTGKQAVVCSVSER